MFTFPLPAVRAVITRGQEDAALNGGFRNPHYGLAPGKDERSGLWLVGDEGVYLMSNGRLADGARAMVCYANECNPHTNPDWYAYKHRHFGGDDGVEFLAAEDILTLADSNPSATGFRIHLCSTSMSLELAFD